MTISQYRKLTPPQERMMNRLERELHDIDEGEQRKLSDDEDKPDQREPQLCD